MVKFPEVDLAEKRREIFNLINKKDIEILTQKQIHVQSLPHQYQQHMPSNPVYQSNYSSRASFPNEPPTTSQGTHGGFSSHFHMFRHTRQETFIIQCTSGRINSYACF